MSLDTYQKKFKLLGTIIFTKRGECVKLFWKSVQWGKVFLKSVECGIVFSKSAQSTKLFWNGQFGTFKTTFINWPNLGGGGSVASQPNYYNIQNGQLQYQTYLNWKCINHPLWISRSTLCDKLSTVGIMLIPATTLLPKISATQGVGGFVARQATFLKIS